jgi:hypothetical protein
MVTVIVMAMAMGMVMVNNSHKIISQWEAIIHADLMYLAIIVPRWMKPIED